jgi:HEAT repeat protein
MSNPASRIAAALVLISAGFAFGVLVGKRRSADPRGIGSDPASATSSARSQGPGSAARVASGDASSDPDKVAMAERIRVLEAEVRVLREGNGVTAKAAAAEEADLAERAYRDWIALTTGNIQNSEQLRALFGRLLKLNPTSARTFIDLFRKAPASKSTERQAALQMAMWVGGGETAEFLHVLLKDPSLEPALRTEILNELGATGAGLFSIKRLPVDEALGSTAMTLTRSGKVEERRAGAGLLGGVATPESRLELLRLLNEDPDSGVKTVAIRSLTYVGDLSMRKTLETYAAQSADAGLQKAAAAAIQELEKSPR